MCDYQLTQQTAKQLDNICTDFFTLTLDLRPLGVWLAATAAAVCCWFIINRWKKRHRIRWSQLWCLSFDCSTRSLAGVHDDQEAANVSLGSFSSRRVMMTSHPLEIQPVTQASSSSSSASSSRSCELPAGRHRHHDHVLPVPRPVHSYKNRPPG